MIGSGSLTHNLYEFRMGSPEGAAYAREFSLWIRQAVQAGDRERLLQALEQAPHAARAHPTAEHFLPLLVALGASPQGAPATVLDGGIRDGVLAMESYLFGREVDIALREAAQAGGGMSDGIDRRRAAGRLRADLVLLFHGVGASAANLLPLAEWIAQGRPDAFVVSVDAPHPSGLGSGREWFSVLGVTEDNRVPRIAEAMPLFRDTVARWQAESGLGAAAHHAGRLLAGLDHVAGIDPGAARRSRAG